MVVPIERVKKSDKRKQYVGNNLTIDIRNNNSSIQVTGNNCKINLGENTGHIRVIGDNCEINIAKGTSNVDYIGNNGKIDLGEEVDEETITFVGQGGEISSRSKSTDSSTKEEQKEPCDHSATPSVNISVEDVEEFNSGYPYLSNLHVKVPTIHISKKIGTTRFKTN